MFILCKSEYPEGFSMLSACPDRTGLDAEALRLNFEVYEARYQRWINAGRSYEQPLPPDHPRVMYLDYTVDEVPDWPAIDRSMII